MRFSVSTCSFYKNKIKKLLCIPEDYGVEIFADFGSTDCWYRFADELRSRGNRGSFSMHGPFTFVDLANTENFARDLETVKYYFDAYHSLSAEFYVMHAYGCTLSRDEKYLSEARKRATERIALLRELCEKNEVALLLENTCDGIVPLFNEAQFLELFREIPELNCLIDVGHAVICGMDVAALQRALNSRVKAYHLHSNNGLADQHLRLREGMFDWQEFCANVNEYTPDAVGVIEYMQVDDMRLIGEDVEYLRAMLK